MIRKYVCAILMLTLTISCICSCSIPHEQNSDESMNTERLTRLEQLARLEGDSPIAGDSTVKGTCTQLVYMTFEECLSLATHVATATYKGEYKTRGKYKDLVFVLEEQYKGTDLPNEFHVTIENAVVSVSDKGIGYSTSADNYKAGETYLLVLEKRVSVYHPYDRYLPFANIMITSDSATMYDGTNVKAHSNELEDSSPSYVMNYVKNHIKDSAPRAAVGHDYIRNATLENVIGGSSIIAVITPKEYTGGSENNNTDRYVCTVNEVIKGSLNDTDIEIIFVADSVEIGNRYVVMLERAGVFYVLSSKNSVHDAADSTVIQQAKEMVSVD